MHDNLVYAILNETSGVNHVRPVDSRRSFFLCNFLYEKDRTKMEPIENAVPQNQITTTVGKLSYKMSLYLKLPMIYVQRRNIPHD